MNKVFWFLVTLCFVGAAALWWMLGVVDHDSQAYHEKALLGEEGKVVEPEPASPDREDKVSENRSHFLELFSEPPSASVFLNGEFRGKTPLKIDLEKRAFQLSIQSEGFEDYNRELPSAEDVEGDLIWKVQLKERSEKDLSERETPADQKKNASSKKASSEEIAKEVKKVLPKTKPTKRKSSKINRSTPVAPTTRESLKIRFRRGNFKKSFIQLKSIPLDEFLKVTPQSEKTWFKSPYTPFACRVDLGAKGRWVRVLLGSFESSLIARAALLENKKKLPKDSYVTGGQKCL